MSILRSLRLAALLALASAAPAGALVHLPTQTRTLTASTASAACRGTSAATTTWTAPMAGFLSAHLGARGGEWDLYATDARSHRTLSSSRAFGANEIAQSFVSAGQRVRLTACRTAGSVSKATLAIDFSDAARPAKAISSMVRIKGASQGIFRALEENGFDVTDGASKQALDVFLPDQGTFARFKKLGLNFTTLVANEEALDARNRAREAARARAGVRSTVPTGRTTYRYMSDIQAEMAKIVADNPTTARPVTIGTTYLGRPIQGVELSDDVKATDDGKPVYVVVAEHHAREWPSAEIAMEFLQLIAKNQADPRIASLLARERIVIIPVLNVDGYISSRGENATGTPVPDPVDTAGAPSPSSTAEGAGAGGTLAYRRKNCDTSLPQASSAFQNPATQAIPCYYAYGVDPNRNYGFDWGGSGASTDPTTQSYRGTAQWSEPETSALWHYFQTHPVTATITIHTVAALVLRSPGLHTHGLAPDELMLRELGDKMAGFTGYKSQFGWELYDTTGTMEDWNYGAAGALGYTIELGNTSDLANGTQTFHGDWKDSVEDQWNGPTNIKPGSKTPDGTKIVGGGMKEALLTAAGYAADPKTHAILTGTGQPGATIEVKKTFNTDSSPLCTYSQGFVNSTAGGPAEPLYCVAPGTMPATSTPDQLDYKTVVRPDGTFTWHITQSTRPFKGYEFVRTNNPPAKPQGTIRDKGVKEQWTLTCNGKSQQVTIERGQTLALGDVCS
jgi:hypothetical protein